MRLFNAGMVERVMNTAGLAEDVPIESKMVSRSIQSAQTQVEAQNYEIRKNVLKYDDVMNRQRTVIYDERRRVLMGADIHEQVRLFINDVVEGYVDSATAEGFPETWDLDQLWTAIGTLFPCQLTLAEVEAQAGGRARLTAAHLKELLTSEAHHAYDAREASVGEETMRELERRVGFLAEYLRHTRTRGLVLGISGGIDSTVGGRLCQLACERVRAAGGEATFVAVRLPYGVQADEEDARLALRAIAPDEVAVVDIKPGVDGLWAACVAGVLSVGDDRDDFVKGNVKARARMVAQYTIAGPPVRSSTACSRCRVSSQTSGASRTSPPRSTRDAWPRRRRRTSRTSSSSASAARRSGRCCSATPSATNRASP